MALPHGQNSRIPNTEPQNHEVRTSIPRPAPCRVPSMCEAASRRHRGRNRNRSSPASSIPIAIPISSTRPRARTRTRHLRVRGHEPLCCERVRRELQQTAVRLRHSAVGYSAVLRFAMAATDCPGRPGRKLKGEVDGIAFLSLCSPTRGSGCCFEDLSIGAGGTAPSRPTSRIPMGRVWRAALCRGCVHARSRLARVASPNAQARIGDMCLRLAGRGGGG